MSDSPGQMLSFPGGLDPENRSTNITAMTFAAVLCVSLTSYPLAATQGTPEPVVSVAHRDVAGERVELFGGQLFGKIIIIPGSKALGFVVTATQFAIEVWNTFTDTDQVLDAITISGTGGLTVADPYGEPLLFAAMDSRIYQAMVPSAGATQIDQIILFSFTGDPPGTSLGVTGSRIVLFSVALDWGEGVEETIEYLTDVLKAYSDNEQRRALRQFPRRALRFRALTLNARDAAGLESLVWGWQHRPYGVPWWPDAQPLLADVPAGSYAIPVNTADRQFAAGGLVAIWKDEYTFEALTISTVASNSLGVTSPTQFSWPGGPGTRVLPVFLCRLPASIDLSRHSSEIDQVDLSFIGESGQPAPAPAISPTQFKGYDVLEIPPNWDGAPLKRSYKRSLVTIDPKVGPIQVIDKGGSPVVGQEFPWWLHTHPVVTAFRAFILRRRGQLVPFWIPTWDQDLVLANNVGPSDSGITIKSEFYSRFFFPNAARRFLAFIPADLSGNVYRKITAAADNGDGTEGLTLESATGKSFPKGSTMISFLTLARLADDRVAIKWDSCEHAEALLSLQEVPRELP
jgi:hypothetical protein